MTYYLLAAKTMLAPNKLMMHVFVAVRESIETASVADIGAQLLARFPHCLTLSQTLRDDTAESLKNIQD